jgi:sugar lactone lactonase YvrE
MRIPRMFAVGFALLVYYCALAGGQTWTTLTNAPPAPLGTALLLTDGTVMAQGMATSGYATGNWYRLTPTATGSYVSGTWSTLASMPSGYSPLYYASAVLPDGRVVVVGGEYNNNAEAETNLGAIYNPAGNAWTSITPPSGWTHIGDAASVVLANGTFMIGNCGVAGSECTNQTYQAQLNATSLTWTIIGSGNGKADQNSEEGWELLPNGDVLVADVWDGTNSEVFNPSTSKWTTAGSTVATLPNRTCEEIGPAVLRPEGSVFAVGGTSATAVYTTSTGTWAAGPTIPSSYGVEDGPAAILPDGNVLIDVGPQSPCYAVGSHFYEFNGSTLTAVAGPSRAASDATYVGRMLVLPAGQILFTDGSTTVEVYTAAGTYQTAWQPTITSVASTLTAGSTSNVIKGSQFNGLSQGAAYGDDAQMATNYPLVRITNNASGDVVYCKTHNHSTMAVATGSATVSTEFDIPRTIQTGASTLAVVANGIPSEPFAVTVAAPVIKTVAGDGTAGYSGDGGAATSAELNYPVSAAVDTAANIYFPDFNNQRIRKVTAASGDISTVAGDGTAGYSGDGGAATSAELNYPVGAVVDSAGDIYIADTYNQRIRKVTASTGKISTVAGNGTSGYSGDGGAATSAELNYPQSVAVDGSGNIYIADTGNQRIRKVTASTGIISTVAGGGTGCSQQTDSVGDGCPAASADLYYPEGVVLDTVGDIYIADSNNQRIREVTASTGIISTVAGDGTKGYSGDGGAATSAELNYPCGVALDVAGNIYIVDEYNQRIREVTASTGIISTVTGDGTRGYSGDGGAPTSAELNYPQGVAVDIAGNIYIADAENYRVRMAGQ